MQIVIDIPEILFEKIQNGKADKRTLETVIMRGTLLPKGHGRLIDEKDLSLMTVHLIDGIFVCDAPTIIEAEESEG